VLLVYKRLQAATGHNIGHTFAPFWDIERRLLRDHKSLNLPLDKASLRRPRNIGRGITRRTLTFEILALGM
jgi:hypothetical protein